MSLPQDVMTYGTLSIASYADSGVVPPGWEIVPNGQISDPVSGFAATAFRNPLTGEIVVAFRGTDGLNDMTESNLALLLQTKPGTFDKARAFFTDIRNQFTNSPISVTGHSLGGAFAQLIGALEKAELKGSASQYFLNNHATSTTH